MRKILTLHTKWLALTLPVVVVTAISLYSLLDAFVTAAASSQPGGWLYGVQQPALELQQRFDVGRVDGALAATFTTPGVDSGRVELELGASTPTRMPPATPTSQPTATPTSQSTATPASEPTSTATSTLEPTATVPPTLQATVTQEPAPTPTVTPSLDDDSHGNRDKGGDDDTGDDDDSGDNGGAGGDGDNGDDHGGDDPDNDDNGGDDDEDD